MLTQHSSQIFQGTIFSKSSKEPMSIFTRNKNKKNIQKESSNPSLAQKNQKCNEKQQYSSNSKENWNKKENQNENIPQNSLDPHLLPKESNSKYNNKPKKVCLPRHRNYVKIQKQFSNLTLDPKLEENAKVCQQSSVLVINKQKQESNKQNEESTPQDSKPIKRKYSKTQSFEIFYDGSIFIVDPVSLSNFSEKFSELIKPFISDYEEMRELRLKISGNQFTKRNMNNFLRICQKLPTDVKNSEMEEICEIAKMFKAENVYKTGLSFINAYIDSDFSVPEGKYDDSCFSLERNSNFTSQEPETKSAQSTAAKQEEANNNCMSNTEKVSNVEAQTQQDPNLCIANHSEIFDKSATTADTNDAVNIPEKVNQSANSSNYSNDASDNIPENVNQSNKDDCNDDAVKLSSRLNQNNDVNLPSNANNSNDDLVSIPACANKTDDVSVNLPSNANSNIDDFVSIPACANSNDNDDAVVKLQQNLNNSNDDAVKSVIYMVRVENHTFKCPIFKFVADKQIVYSAKQKLNDIFVGEGGEIHIRNKENHVAHIFQHESDNFNRIHIGDTQFQLKYVNSGLPDHFSLEVSFPLNDKNYTLSPKRPSFDVKTEQYYLDFNGEYQHRPMISSRNIVLQNEDGLSNFIVRKMDLNLYEIECNQSIDPLIAFTIGLSDIVGPYNHPYSNVDYYF